MPSESMRLKQSIGDDRAQTSVDLPHIAPSVREGTVKITQRRARLDENDGRR
jgi:hypothetical protein